ncbi:DUF397 domain-containing protein [Streptomyces radiopugnans]|nr:DUF397 domain-containing protein [Streptomyces radiopugnans]
MDFQHARWRKGTGSGDSGCVEVALETRLIGVRDTKDLGTGPVLAFRPSVWTSFLNGLRGDDFTPEWTEN